MQPKYDNLHTIYKQWNLHMKPMQHTTANKTKYAANAGRRAGGRILERMKFSTYSSLATEAFCLRRRQNKAVSAYDGQS